jgi:hypothetical protein
MTAGAGLPLDPPALQVGGLRLWIHGRESPDDHDKWDGNWLVVTVRCEAPGAAVHVNREPILLVPELAQWRSACEALAAGGPAAALEPIEPNLKVRIERSDRLGHFRARVMVTPDTWAQEHRFDFEIDTSELDELVRRLREIVLEYPVRG